MRGREKRQSRSLEKYKKAKLQAGIKPTALCSAIDKENLIEFPLDFSTTTTWSVYYFPILIM